MKLEEIKTILVIGAGTMGEGIVQNFAQAGYDVRVVARKQETLDLCIKIVANNLKTFQEHGLIKESPKTIMTRVKAILNENFAEAVKGVDYVVETIPENLAAKKETFLKLDDLPKDVIVASNTGSFPLDTLTEGLKSPQRFVGAHYFNPAHIIPLVEIHRGSKTTEETVDLTRKLLEKIGKKTVLVRKVVPGFIINRLTGAMEREIDYLLDEGIVTPEELDVAVKSSIGFRLSCMGPQQQEDMIGLDIAAVVGSRIFKVLSTRTDPSPALLAKVNKGELGIKSGKGWYDYSGKSREEVLEGINQTLLQQLKLFKSRQ
jgi:3-hydroxybutyryl-CoA dehydrogenase